MFYDFFMTFYLKYTSILKAHIFRFAILSLGKVLLLNSVLDLWEAVSFCFWASLIRIRYSEVWIWILRSPRKNSKKIFDF
jgi:hypothetical protein